MQRLHADPFDWNTLYGTNWQNCGEDGLYVSTNGGSAWTYKPGPPIGPVTLEGFDHSLPVWADRQKQGHLWMGTGLGIAHSDDYGDHWTDFSRSLRASQVCDIAQAPSDPTRLLAATYGMGLAHYGTLWFFPLMKIYPHFEWIQGVAPFTLSGSSTVTGGAEPYSYVWDYGDGSPPEASPRALHVYTVPGTYRLRLTVTDANGEVGWSAPETVQVFEPLSVTAAATPHQGSPPLEVSFSASIGGGAAPYVYEWEFGDGAPVSTSPAPSHTYLSPGRYRWSLLVTDSGGGTGSATGTVDTAGRCLVTCTASAPTAGAVGNDLVFEGDAVPSECVEAANLQWDFGDGSTAEGSPVSHAYASPGTYGWSLSASADGILCRRGGWVTVVEAAACVLICSGQAQPASGTAPLTVAFTADATATDCTEAPSFLWDFGDGTGSAEQNPSHNYVGPGTFPWTVTASANGRSASSGGEVNVAEPPCTLTCAATVPAWGQTGTSVDFAASASPEHCQGQVSFDWDFGDGSAHAAEASTAHAYAAPGAYTWTLAAVVDSESCIRQGVVTVVQAPSLTALVKASDPFRVKVFGASFAEGASVFLGGSPEPWLSVRRKGDSKLVLRGGASLKALFPKGVPVTVKVVNPDGGWAEAPFVR
jgi:PKD repeat protein